MRKQDIFTIMCCSDIFYILLFSSCMHHKLNSINLHVRALCSVSVWLQPVLHHTEIYMAL